ncbi:hypothetical protein BGW38_005619, partial [Lunasporangiospora selenospora]
VYPNDLIHRQTRQRLAAFLRERVALFPYLRDIYAQLMPLSSVHYFYSWRWPQYAADYRQQQQLQQWQQQQQPHPSTRIEPILGSRNPSVASSHGGSCSEEESSDSGFHDTGSLTGGLSSGNGALLLGLGIGSMAGEGALTMNEEDMDEDREWGLIDEDEVLPPIDFKYDQFLSPIPSTPKTISPGTGPGSAPWMTPNSYGPFGGCNRIYGKSFCHLPRDRRSSTGSFAHNSPCAMETFVAGRRGSASSIASNPGPFSTTTGMALTPGSMSSCSGAGSSCFAEGVDLSQMQPSPLAGPIPFIGKRSSSQAYRQLRGGFLSTGSPSGAQSVSSTPSSGRVTPVPVAPGDSAVTLVTVPALTATTPTLTNKDLPFPPVLEERIHPLGHLPQQSPQQHHQHQFLHPFHHHGHQHQYPQQQAQSKTSSSTLAHHHHHPFSLFGHGPHQHPHSHPCVSPSASIAPVSTPEPISIHTPFLEISNLEIAEQLTCVEFGLFRRLKPRDLLRHVWKSKRGSNAFQACVTHFNFISSWVGTMILSSSPTKAKTRAKMMEKFIWIAKHLRDMGNYNTTMAILGALNMSPIHRLTQTREILKNSNGHSSSQHHGHGNGGHHGHVHSSKECKKGEAWETFKELEQLMSSERSYAEYRASLKTRSMPCIPYLGVHSRDLLSISEGNKDFRIDGTLHWQKFILLTEVISTVMSFQKSSYTAKPDPIISRIITETPVLSEDEMYAKSTAVEPGKLNHSRSLSKFTFF